jgi:hypothetical protein
MVCFAKYTLSKQQFELVGPKVQTQPILFFTGVDLAQPSRSSQPDSVIGSDQ